MNKHPDYVNANIWEPTCPPITTADLTDALRRHRSIVLQFWAVWDDSGRLLDACLCVVLPSVGKGLTFYSVDVDAEAAGLTASFGIQTTPTLVFLLDGVEVDRRSGLGPLPELAVRLHRWREAAEYTKQTGRGQPG